MEGEKNGAQTQGFAVIVVVICAVLLFLAAGVAAGMTLSTIKNNTGDTPLAYASDGNSALSFPAGADVNQIGTCLDNYLKSKKPSSPLVGQGVAIAQAGKNTNINPAFLVAISGQESSFGTVNGGNPNKENYFNVKCSSKLKGTCNGGYQHFANIEEAISEHANLLVRVYFSLGLNTIKTIQEKYCPAYDSPLCGQHWIDGVTKIFNEATGKCTMLAPVASGAVVGKGQFYNPLGGYANKIIGFNNSPHPNGGPAGHTLFEITPFNNGFQNASDGAIDLNVENGSGVPIYASFDGKIVKSKKIHNSSYGKGGGVLWEISNDGTVGAVYAHIEFYGGSNAFPVGTLVKKGDQIGTTAKHCGQTSSDQCVQFRGNEHLHFQFYINKNVLTKSQLIKQFGLTT